MKRIGIFVFYDRDGIVDSYVEYFLTALLPHLNKLIIVCNGNLNLTGRECLKQFTSDIFIRENTGFDAMAYKLAMTSYVGWDALNEYDELVLMNDTFYGPLYPMDEMFQNLNKRTCDFWGITSHEEYIDYYSKDSKRNPAYIQSYFMGIRKGMFQSKMFQDYWNKFDSTTWLFSDILNRHEKKFTSAMEQAGFSWDTYVHAIEYESKKPENNFIQYYYIAYQLIKDYRCPFIKKKNFISKRLTANPGELGNDTSKAFLWIKENTDYSVNMIWENLLRLFNIKDIQKALNMNYIISDNSSISIMKKEKILVFVCTVKPLTKQQESFIRLLKADVNVLDVQCIIYHAANSTESLADILFIEETEWEYILLLTDITSGNEMQTALHNYSAVEEQWGNLIGKASYISEVINLFAENNRLGVLLAPSGIHGADFGSNSEFNSQGCMALWCRKKIFRKLKNKLMVFIEYPHTAFVDVLRNDFSTIAQQMGYYTAVVMKSSYASMAFTNMDEMLRQIVKHEQYIHTFHDFGSFLDKNMFLFCEKYSQIFVYGAGENGCRAASLIIKEGYRFSGFIVSDDQPNLEEKCGYPVYRLSMLGETEFCAGIVISVSSRKSQSQIKLQLRQRGFKNIYLVDT